MVTHIVCSMNFYKREKMYLFRLREKNLFYLPRGNEVNGRLIDGKTFS
jgi:hypothetical protein